MEDSELKPSSKDASFFYRTLQQSVLTMSTDDLELGVGWRWGSELVTHDEIRVQNDLKSRQYAETKKVKYRSEEKSCLSSKWSSRGSRGRCAA